MTLSFEAVATKDPFCWSFISPAGSCTSYGVSLWELFTANADCPSGVCFCLKQVGKQLRKWEVVVQVCDVEPAFDRTY